MAAVVVVRWRRLSGTDPPSSVVVDTDDVSLAVADVDFEKQLASRALFYMLGPSPFDLTEDVPLLQSGLLRHATSPQVAGPRGSPMTIPESSQLPFQLLPGPRALQIPQ